ELRVTPSPDGRHGALATRLAGRLDAYVHAHELGHVFNDAAFELIDLPRTVRAPDVAFVRAGRLRGTEIPDGAIRLAPDLAVEILSPSETASRLEEKLDDYQ